MMKMRSMMAALLMAGGVAAADPVAPMVVNMTNLTDQAGTPLASRGTYYQGDTLSLSNSVMYSGSTTNAPLQNLHGCTIRVRAGSQDNTNLLTRVTGYIVNTNTGLYGAEFTLPAVDPCFIEVSVSNVNVRTYELQQVRTRQHLGD